MPCQAHMHPWLFTLLSKARGTPHGGCAKLRLLLLSHDSGLEGDILRSGCGLRLHAAYQRDFAPKLDGHEDLTRTCSAQDASIAPTYPLPGSSAWRAEISGVPDLFPGREVGSRDSEGVARAILCDVARVADMSPHSRWMFLCFQEPIAHLLFTRER